MLGLLFWDCSFTAFYLALKALGSFWEHLGKQCKQNKAVVSLPPLWIYAQGLKIYLNCLESPLFFHCSHLCNIWDCWHCSYFCY